MVESAPEGTDSMMVNVYDRAHELAWAIQGSKEYAEYRSALQALRQDQGAWEMVRDFRTRQLALQAEAIGGGEPEEEKKRELERLYEIISMHAGAARFLETEYRFLQMMGDIQKIIAAPLEGLEE